MRPVWGGRQSRSYWPKAWLRRASVVGIACLSWEASAQNSAAPDQVQPASATVPSFDVLELRVVGNTVLDARSIESAIYPFVGPAKQMADVEAARAALERTYHERGFGSVFVDIPEQSVEEGIVRLRVTEGRLRQVRVNGAHYFSGRQILAALPAATEGSVPNLPLLQNQVTALNARTRDQTVVPVLKAGPQPGTVDLALKTEDHLPFHGSIELNNQYTVDTSHLRALFAASYDDLFGRLDSVSLQYQVAPEAAGQVHVIAGSYTARLGDDGSNVAFQYVNSKSDVATIGTLGVLGTGSVYGLRWTQPFSSVGSSQAVTLGVDFKDFGQSILVSSGGLSTPVSYVNLSALYSAFIAVPNRQWDLSTTINFGIRGVQDNVTQFADKRYDAQPNYFYVRSDGGVTLQLPARLSLALRLTGQWAVDPLISNEQLPVGGASSVRGYLEAEELGDSGIRGSLQLGGPPFLFNAGRMHFNEFLFFDAARFVVLDPLPGQIEGGGLRSFGAGLRLDGFGHLYATLTWADPLVDAMRTLRNASTVLFVIHAGW